MLRVIAARKGSATFLDEPNNVYMKIRELLNKKQTGISDIFFSNDEELLLVPAFDCFQHTYGKYTLRKCLLTCISAGKGIVYRC
jgi:hypothetical protein